MQGTFQSILPDKISEETEAILNDLLKRKMKGAASMLVRVMRIMEKKYGSEVYDVVRSEMGKWSPRAPEDCGAPEDDLHEFCDRLDKGCVGSHRWERVVDEPDRIGYRYTKCLWAEIFNELDAHDIGHWLCDGADPAVRSYNPHPPFQRPAVPMD